ncbi:MAG: hypothetical protein Q8Q59_11030 [Luteolibacter sp.]|jgi:hypothetical protein|nr:hypothetical protein [Luteolibacter sp.]
MWRPKRDQIDRQKNSPFFQRYKPSAKVVASSREELIYAAKHLGILAWRAIRFSRPRTFYDRRHITIAGILRPPAYYDRRQLPGNASCGFPGSGFFSVKTLKSIGAG